jgi:hypothetical protein
MIHQMEGVLLIRINRQNISYSYKTKSKSFVIVNDFSRIEASIIFEKKNWVNFEFLKRNLKKKALKLFLPKIFKNLWSTINVSKKSLFQSTKTVIFFNQKQAFFF